MSNKQRLYTVFSTALGINESDIHDDLKYNTIPEWDSTAHMALVAQLESEFDIMLEIDDIIDMSSVSESQRIISNYGIDFNQ